MKLPTLYKKTSTGAIQFWTISVYEDSDHSSAYIIQTDYGQVGTDSPQTTFDTIYEGKNLGKANETSVKEQAEAEAQAKWEKQLKRGYVESIEAAENEELDALIEGGIVPMLAHSFAKHGHKIKFPCYVQPKLDGIRCIAILKDGKCTLWSRTRKPIKSVPHVVAEIEHLYRNKDAILDGELYQHEYKSDFEKIVSLVRQEVPAKDHHIVQYHIYDVVLDEVFELREQTLTHFIQDRIFGMGLKALKVVKTVRVYDEDQISDHFDRFREQGYEGAMVRNGGGLYVNKRSYDLQKVKEFQDSEFPIVGVKEGRGKLVGHAIFICKLENGETFDVKLKGDTDYLKKLWEDESLWKNRLLTVQYQGFTAYGVPRFPVGLRVREPGL